MPKQKDIRSRGSIHVHPCHGCMFVRLGPPDDPIDTFLGLLASLHIHLYVRMLSKLRTPQEGCASKLRKARKHHMGHIGRVRPLQSAHAVFWAQMTG